MRLPRFKRVAVLVWLVTAVVYPCHAVGQTEQQVKAAVIFRLTQFVTWPESAFPTSTSPLEICVFEHAEIGDALDSVAGRRVRERELVVRQADRFDLLRRCQLLLLGDVPTELMQEILSSVDGRPVLTLADGETFSDLGGMITLRVVSNKIRFEINDRVARKAGLSISAKLLRLATIIHK